MDISKTPPAPSVVPSLDRAVETAAAGTLPAGLTVDSADILRGRASITIRHGDALYALRATRNGKLILTK